ncbi:conserved hypothetical protein [Rubrivivax sp. A210]|uniref:NRDE family protein n=1 Tax=Rubrivivax sp. A210 TaxID=2772301 RepID=UPI001917E49B|nr:NRDE family protein [Rubrivivax sp. A210]CAD5374943.1 conserved hypothetical protein [Rubrivivax sp. A210]
MCLAALALGVSARHPFVAASNRDEFFGRASAPLAWWRPAPADEEILGGRDLEAGGTWLGLNRRGRLALVTNVREPGRHDAASPSRGELVPQWLAGGDDAWLDAIAAAPRNGFNLIALDLARGAGHWVGNRPPQRRALGHAIRGLSNAALDTPWPKVVALKQRLAAALEAPDADALIAAAFAALASTEPAADADLPRTGVTLERERALSPAFIRMAVDGRVYGTRCSTVVVAERLRPMQLAVKVVERSFDAEGRIEGERQTTLALDA